MQQKFVVLSYPRTGSTFFVKALNTPKNVLCLSEIFHNNQDAFIRAFYNEKQLLPKTGLLRNIHSFNKWHKKKKRNPKSFLNAICNHNNQMEAIGFKIFKGQNDFALNYLIDNHNYKKIILGRKNRLQTYISHQLAKKTGSWDKTTDVNMDQVKINLNETEFLEYVRHVESIEEYYIQKLLKANQDYIMLDYDQIVSHFPKDNLEEFLGISFHGFTTSTDQKKQVKNYESMINNYNEILVNPVFNKYL